MSDILTAASEVKKLVNMFQSLGAIVDVLDRLGSIEQAESEATARIELLTAKAKEIDEANESAKQAGKQIESDACATSQAMIDQAKSDAELILSQASESAELMEVQSIEALEQIKERVAEYQKQSDAIIESIAQKQEEIEALEAKFIELDAQKQRILG